MRRPRRESATRSSANIWFEVSRPAVWVARMKVSLPKLRFLRYARLFLPCLPSIRNLFKRMFCSTSSSHPTPNGYFLRLVLRASNDYATYTFQRFFDQASLEMWSLVGLSEESQLPSDLKELPWAKREFRYAGWQPVNIFKRFRTFYTILVVTLQQRFPQNAGLSKDRANALVVRREPQGNSKLWNVSS